MQADGQTHGVVLPRTQFDRLLSTAFGRTRGTFGQEDVLDTLADLERPVGPTNHRCVIHETNVEQLVVVVPLVLDSLEHGARCLYIADEHQIGGVESALRAGGVDVPAVLASGALRITTKNETYQRFKAFDPKDMIALLESSLAEALADGFNGLCVTAEMTWSLAPDPGNERLIEYESTLNTFLAVHPNVVAIHQYNRKRFPPETIRNVIRTHPVIGFGGEMSQNPFYVPPEEFLDKPQISREVDRMLASITIRQRIANDLRAAGYYTRSLYDLNLDAMVTTTPGGAIRDVNGKMESLLGLPRQEILGTDLSAHFSDAASTADFLGRVSTEGAVENCELSAVANDGRTTPVSLNAFALHDSVGRIRAIISSARDLSEERRLEELRQRALESSREFDRARTDFVARVSHELRSPLASVLGYVELLTDADASPLDAEQRSMLGVIERNGIRLLKLVEDLLTMSRISAGTLEVHRGPVALASILEHAIEGFRPEMAKQHLTSEVAVEDGVIVNVDTEQVVRAVVNLISNAVKFTPPEGHIYIEGKRDGDDAVISVRDTGIGIPLDEQSRLFTRFFRSSLSRQRETQGTGIGLFLVKQIIEAHDGTIEVVSRPGDGTTVLVRLPLPAPA